MMRLRLSGVEGAGALGEDDAVLAAVGAVGGGEVEAVKQADRDVAVGVVVRVAEGVGEGEHALGARALDREGAERILAVDLESSQWKASGKAAPLEVFRKSHQRP
jgi:hypothetical protein